MAVQGLWQPPAPEPCFNSPRSKIMTSRVSAASRLLCAQLCRRCLLEVLKMSSKVRQHFSRSSVNCRCCSRTNGPITVSLSRIIYRISSTWITGFTSGCLLTFTFGPEVSLLLQQHQKIGRSRRVGSSSRNRKFSQRQQTAMTAARLSLDPVVAVEARIQLVIVASSVS